MDNFPLLKVKNMGKFFQNFFAGRGKNRFLWQNIHLCFKINLIVDNPVMVTYVKIRCRPAMYKKGPPYVMDEGNIASFNQKTRLCLHCGPRFAKKMYIHVWSPIFYVFSGHVNRRN